MLCWFTSLLFGLFPLQNITKLRLENSWQKFSPTKNSLQNLTYFQNVISNPAESEKIHVYYIRTVFNSHSNIKAWSWGLRIRLTISGKYQVWSVPKTISINLVWIVCLSRLMCLDRLSLACTNWSLIRKVVYDWIDYTPCVI
jgi:hypothetical protein